MSDLASGIKFEAWPDGGHNRVSGQKSGMAGDDGASDDADETGRVHGSRKRKSRSGAAVYEESRWRRSGGSAIH